MPITSSITLAGQTCLLTVPQGTRAVGRATSLTCPLGPAPTRAWVLMERAALAEVPENAPVSLVWSLGGNTITFPGLYLKDASRVGFGGVGDANAVFLAELVDARFIAARNSDTGLIAANHRSYAQTDDDENSRAYLSETGGQTWASLAAALWASAGVLGPFPGLPVAPDWRPEQQRFAGTSGYGALNAFLDFLDCALCHNPTTNVYTIVALGAAQALPDHASELKWDGETKNYPATTAAASVTSYFPTHFRAYGQENDTPQIDNWAAARYATGQSVATNIDGAIGSVPLWQDLPRVFGKDDLDANAARRQIRAENVANRYKARVSVPREHKVYYGLVADILPGARVRAVQWRHFGDRDGTETEYFSGPNLPSDVGGAKPELTTICDLQPTENYAAPDLARRSYPNYPRLPNIVQIAAVGDSPGDAAPDAGSMVMPNAQGLHRAKEKRWVGGVMTEIQDCYVRFVDDFDTKAGQVPAKQGDYYYGRLSGLDTIDEEDRPLYLVRRGSDDIIFFELYEDLDLGGSASAYILEADGDGWAAPVNGVTTQVTVQDPYFEGMWQGFAGYRGFARKHQDGENYDILFMEEIARWIAYTLNEDLTPQPISVAEATVDAYHDGKTPGTPRQVYDSALTALGIFGKWHVEGCRGWAHWNDFFKRYEITTPQLMCMHARATLKYAVCPDNTGNDVEVENWQWLEQGYYSYSHERLIPANVKNPHAHIGTAGKGVILTAYIGDDGEIDWMIIDIELTVGYVATGIAFLPDSCAFRVDKAEVKLQTCGNVSSETVSPFVAKNIVTSIEHQSGTETIEGVETPYCRTVKTTQTFCMIPKYNELGETDEETTTLVDYTAQPTLVDWSLNAETGYVDFNVCVVWSACIPTCDTVQGPPIGPCQDPPA